MQEALGPRGYTQVRCTCRSLEAPLGPAAWTLGAAGIEARPKEASGKTGSVFLPQNDWDCSVFLALPALSLTRHLQNVPVPLLS